ncbi:MAG: hypothetical protein H8D45_28480 [Bacteroidetes bacterium]|nr:hypothetical protein [Bacteroidota bacterium]
MITKDKVIEIASEYLGEGFNGELKAHEGLPEYSTIYGANRFPSEAWYIHAHDYTNLHIGSGRMIGINKQTGEIFYDETDGGE